MRYDGARRTQFQSPDGDFVYSDVDTLTAGSGTGEVSFNPLTGISSILTVALARRQAVGNMSFNPLTGISSILTAR